MTHVRYTTFIFVVLFCATQLFAQWSRQDSIQIPDLNLNVGSIGNVVTGADTDGDGLLEIFMANDNSNDTPDELVPRLYKLEQDGAGGWTTVWSTELAGIAQNTWPALTVDDLDEDGKEEIIWGPVNNFAGVANPPRIVIFESVGDGSDDMGVSDGFGGFLPNTQFTMTNQDNLNLRPTNFVVNDVDGDGTKEVIFNDRTGTSSGWYFGVLSVDDIPDAGDGSETWTVESNGLTVPGGPISGAENKWDVAVLDGTIYLFDEITTTRVRATAADTYELLEDLPPVAGGGGPFNSVEVYDIDGNAQPEIIFGTYWTPFIQDDSPAGVYVYEYDAEGDSLKGTLVADLSAYGESIRLGGGAIGDVDVNGRTDYIVGSRFAEPNAAIFRLEYTGAQDDVSNIENWTHEIIDSEYAPSGFWNVIGLANIDDDLGTEVMYTTSFGPETKALVVLNVEPDVSPGVWQLDQIQYSYDGVVDTTGAVHGVAVDGNNRLWIGTFSGGVFVYNEDGSEFMTLDSTTVEADGGGDSTVFLTGCRGLATDNDGNIIYTKSGGTTLKLDPSDGSTLARVELGLSQGAPMVDDEGFIYTGAVVFGGNPFINVINPATFDVTQTITLDPLAGGFHRGIYVSPDGLTLIPGNLAEGVHSLYIYESTDFINYPLADSIRNDNTGKPIFEAQSVTLDRSSDGKFWVSQDNAYAGTQDVNAIVWFDPRDNTYGYVWMPQDNGDDTDGPRGVAFNSDGTVMYTGSFNNGVVYKYTGVFTSLRRHENVVTPENYTLKQNYPNPFNPTTTIDFTIAKSGKTVLKVYNVLGQEILTLVNKNLSAGDYSISFDASKLSSGMYIYKLQSGDFTDTRKMTLIK